MPESNLYFERRFTAAEVNPAKTLVGVANPDGGTNDEGAMSLSELGKVVGGISADAYRNMKIGPAALGKLTTGRENFAAGVNALFTLDSGYYNLAIGNDALYSYTNAGQQWEGQNVAVGNSCLSNLLTGRRNTAIGHGAGQDGIGTEAANCAVDTKMVFVGSWSSRGGRPNTTPMTNGIAIGDSALVTNDNTAVLGNTAVTDVCFGGMAGNAKIHGKGDAIVFPSVDPHVVGAAYWVGGVLTRSAG